MLTTHRSLKVRIEQEQPFMTYRVQEMRPSRKKLKEFHKNSEKETLFMSLTPRQRRRQRQTKQTKLTYRGNLDTLLICSLNISLDNKGKKTEMTILQTEELV